MLTGITALQGRDIANGTLQGRDVKDGVLSGIDATYRALGLDGDGS